MTAQLATLILLAVLHPTVARAAIGSWASRDLAMQVVPIIIGVALLAWCVQLVILHTRPMAADDRDQRDVDDIHRWNGEGR